MLELCQNGSNYAKNNARCQKGFYYARKHNYAISGNIGTQCQWRGVQAGAGAFNSTNSNETAKPDRKPMCWGQVS